MHYIAQIGTCQATTLLPMSTTLSFDSVRFLDYQVKALEENARREALERASKRDVDLLRKDTGRS